MIDPQRKTSLVNPWTFNERHRRCQKMEDRPSLAVDLSIWICESLTSRAMNDHNENPTLHLVFTRTMKLLSMGIKLIFVIEGKRRVRSSKLNDTGEKHQDKFRKRRTGTSFWNACKQCETMLEMLGVPVVRAKAEGEALCAFLNTKGIVDGVISNDGDCLLFGAKVVYTKFSIDNLDKGCVMRYTASRIHAVVDKKTLNDKSQDGVEQTKCAQNPPDTDGIKLTNVVYLSRKDLVAFALLTGSDLAGDGLDKIGYKKAIRFIRKCKMDRPLSTATAAMDELESWARSVKPIIVSTSNAMKDGDGSDRDSSLTTQEEDDVQDGTCNATKSKQKSCCSRCNHIGSKRSHEKDGCEACCTAPGEPCHKQSTEDKFRKSLRAKALALRNPKFDPTLVVNAYMRPNDNQMPASLLLAGITSSKKLHMGFPKLRDLVEWPVVVKGHALDASQAYLKQSAAKLLARTGLFQSLAQDADGTVQGQGLSSHQNHRLCPRDQPVPTEIVRKLVQNRVDCYEVSWAMKATITNEDGDGIDGYEFSTIEPQDMVNQKHPQLVEAFRSARQQPTTKQSGETELQKRREFLESLFGTEADPIADPKSKPREHPQCSKDQRNFHCPRVSKESGQVAACNFSREVTKPNLNECRKTAGDDVEQLLRYANKCKKKSMFPQDDVDDFDYSSIESGSLATELWLADDKAKPFSRLKTTTLSQTKELQHTSERVKTAPQGIVLRANYNNHAIRPRAHPTEQIQTQQKKVNPGKLQTNMKTLQRGFKALSKDCDSRFNADVSKSNIETATRHQHSPHAKYGDRDPPIYLVTRQTQTSRQYPEDVWSQGDRCSQSGPDPNVCYKQEMPAQLSQPIKLASPNLDGDVNRRILCNRVPAGKQIRSRVHPPQDTFEDNVNRHWDCYGKQERMTYLNYELFRDSPEDLQTLLSGNDEARDDDEFANDLEIYFEKEIGDSKRGVIKAGVDAFEGIDPVKKLSRVFYPGNECDCAPTGPSQHLSPGFRDYSIVGPMYDAVADACSFDSQSPTEYYHTEGYVCFNEERHDKLDNIEELQSDLNCLQVGDIDFDTCGHSPSHRARVRRRRSPLISRRLCRENEQVSRFFEPADKCGETCSSSFSNYEDSFRSDDTRSNPTSHRRRSRGSHKYVRREKDKNNRCSGGHKHSRKRNCSRESGIDFTTHGKRSFSKQKSRHRSTALDKGSCETYRFADGDHKEQRHSCCCDCCDRKKKVDVRSNSRGSHRPHDHRKVSSVRNCHKVHHKITSRSPPYKYQKRCERAIREARLYRQHGKGSLTPGADSRRRNSRSETHHPVQREYFHHSRYHLGSPHSNDCSSETDSYSVESDDEDFSG